VVFEENGFYARQLARNEPQAKAMGKHKDIFCDNIFADLGLDNADSQFNGTQYELLCNAGLWGNQGEGHSEVFGSDRRGNRLDNAHHIQCQPYCSTDGVIKSDLITCSNKVAYTN
jgi:hypothetical protein